MKGILFDDHEVELDDRTVGGAWANPRDEDGALVAWDSFVVKSFYEHMRQFKNPVVLDIGASMGSFTLLPVIHCGAQVIAFEPNPDVFDILARNVWLNHIEDRVTLMPYAVSDVTGTAALQVPEHKGLSGFSTLGDMLRVGSYAPIQVKTCHLDGLYLGRIDLIKIDTEGAELLVLRGGENTIKRFMPDILLEYCAENTRQFGYEPEELIELLCSWGYRNFVPEGCDDLWATV